MEKYPIVVVRGGGDLASGIIHRLYKCGFPVFVLECENPSAIRREVSFCEAVFDGISQVEDVTCKLVHSVEEGWNCLNEGVIPLLVDPKGSLIAKINPTVIVDAILAKKNIGTDRTQAPIVIGVGPGFEAGRDVDVVVESKRGHTLGRYYLQGRAIENTGIPGIIEGYGKERVIHAPVAGKMHLLCQIGDNVEKGQVIAKIDDYPVRATLTGVLRGILREGYPVFSGLKMADIDPRKNQKENCNTISDKARCISGGVLEAILYLMKNKKLCAGKKHML